MGSTRGKGNVMKFSKKEVNKLVSFVDKEFSYDWRKLKREQETMLFDFIGKDIARNIVVCIENDLTGLYVRITRNDRVIERKYLRSFQDINQFKKLILCIG